MITLPLVRQLWPTLRILTKRRWSDSNTNPRTSDGDWRVWPVTRDGNGGVDGMMGFRVIDWDRACLPMIGRARLGFRYGKIDRKIVGVTADTVGRAAEGTPWNPAVDAVTAPDLDMHEVRIQAAPGGTEDFKTVWWGQVENQQGEGWTAATIPAGERIYHCVDGLARASRWRLDRHGYAVLVNSVYSTLGRMRGHPGYNVKRGHSHFCRIIGNRNTSQWDTEGGLQADYHTWVGQGIGDEEDRWTDRQAVEHALVATRPSGEPWFQMLGFTTLLDGYAAWPVPEGETALEFTNRVCKRERGKGLVFVDWDDDSGDPTGPLTVCLRCRSPFRSNISWIDPPTQATETITVPGTVVDVDLIGDHRAISDSIKLSDKDHYRLDALETTGEFLEVLATLSYTDGLTGAVGYKQGVSLNARFSLADKTAFVAVTDAAQRVDERWRPVYQLHGLPYNWTGTLGDGNNGATVAKCRGDYRCNNAGLIVSPDSPPAPALGEDVRYLTEYTSPPLIKVLGSLPLYEGFKYNVTTPVRWDGATEAGDANRRPPIFMVRVSANRYTKVSELQGNFAYTIDDDGIMLAETSDDGSGTRYFSDTTDDSLDAEYDYTALVFTVALRLPHRVRMYSGLPPADPECSRRMSINHQNLHLWLAHPGAIWDVDATTGSSADGHTPRRNAANGSVAGGPGILRDDRSELARLHALSWEWYSRGRRSGSWALRACGFLSSFQAYLDDPEPDFSEDAEDVAYPALGDLVGTLATNGQTETMDTPITRIRYNNEVGVTTWETDWAALEFDP
jgi:hypothetical protein